MKIQLTLIASLVLSGCATPGPAFTPAPVPASDANQALVYLYRPDAFILGGRDAHFYVDDKQVVDLSRNKHAWIHVPAGHHQFKQKWTWDISTKELVLDADWQAGKSYYYRFSVSGGGYPVITFNWQWQQVPPEVGAREILSTTLQEAPGSTSQDPGRIRER